MDSKELRNLQEAYMEVYEAVDGEGRAYGTRSGPRVKVELPDHMKSVRPRPVMTHAERTKKEASKTPEQTEAERQRRMKLAKTLLRQPQEEQVDIYDIILSHLLDEGYAETPEAAEAIMVNMSEEWRESIVENVSSGRAKVRNVKQRVSSAEIISNTQKQDKIAQHFADHAAKKKAAGDEAHAAATKSGKSPSDAETARQRAHRAYEKQLKRG